MKIGMRTYEWECSVELSDGSEIERILHDRWKMGWAFGGAYDDGETCWGSGGGLFRIRCTA